MPWQCCLNLHLCFLRSIHTCGLLCETRRVSPPHRGNKSLTIYYFSYLKKWSRSASFTFKVSPCFWPQSASLTPSVILQMCSLGHQRHSWWKSTLKETSNFAKIHLSTSARKSLAQWWTDSKVLWTFTYTNNILGKTGRNTEPEAS